MQLPPGLNILVVDDDVQCLGSLEDFLASDGHSIQTATRGRDAVDIAQRFRLEKRLFELTILDFHVPDMSGLETFEQLSRLQPGLNAIFISGEFSVSLEHSILAAGGLALFQKPIDLYRMRRLIETFQGRSPEWF